MELSCDQGLRFQIFFAVTRFIFSLPLKRTKQWMNDAIFQGQFRKRHCGQTHQQPQEEVPALNATSGVTRTG